MAYTDLKQELEKLLSEDLSNRNSLQEMRRNVFLSSETSKQHEITLQKKNAEISDLISAVNAKEKDLLYRASETENLREILGEERKNFEEEKNRLQSEIGELRNNLDSLQNELKEINVLKEEANNLSIENSHFAAKIRELIFHIDEQNTLKEIIYKKTRSTKL
jgi:chromosome segregation ATPase